MLPTPRGALAVLTGFALLVTLDALGRWLVQLTGAAVPGSVVGMLLLTVMIELELLPLEWVRRAAGLLVRHLALLYVPAGVAILVYGDAVRDALVPITVAALASLVAVLVVVGVVVQRLERPE